MSPFAPIPFTALRRRLQRGVISGGAFLLLTAGVHAQIAAGTGNYNANTPGTHTLNVGDTRSIPAGGGEVISVGAPSGIFTLNIDGTVAHDGTGRGIRTSNHNVTFNVNVGLSGLIRASSDDAIQARNGIFNLTNHGTIYSGPNLAAVPSSPLASGQALDLTDAKGGTVLNSATGLIRADGHDAVRVGSNMTLTNLGTIRTAGVVNDTPGNNAFNSPPGSTAETYSANDGVSFENGSGSKLINAGLISGSRHGVETAENATHVTITNEASGQIIGRNGSGVGSDATSASVTNVVVNNYGLIRGDYAGAGNVIDRTGTPSLTHDGDGDGVDIDGAATINNFAGGQIIGNGAGGFDTDGRANTSDGISIGGGKIANEGLVRGAVGIVVNNDTTASRSGVAATEIQNSGTIQGTNGYAIRLENKLGDARDDDVIVNTGTIVGNGAIPSVGTVNRQNNLPDPNSAGTLDAVTYTGTGDARFIRGDGSAIQMGEGNDQLNNSGQIIGNTGRAVSLEGGDDSMRVTGGSISGAVDGGTGVDILSFDLGGPDKTFIQTNGAFSNFEAIDIVSGNVTLSGGQDLGAATNRLTVANNSILSIGQEGLQFSQGTLHADGALHFLLQDGADYSKLTFTAGNLGGLVLGSTSSLLLEFGYTPLLDDPFTLVSFEGSNPFLIGTFAGIAEGEIFHQNGLWFQLSYFGNDGNDIVITRTSKVPDTGGGVLMLSSLIGLAAVRHLRRRRDT